MSANSDIYQITHPRMADDSELAFARNVKLKQAIFHSVVSS